VMCRRGHQYQAFTLPEVLAALMLAAIVLPVVLRGVSLALFASADARHRLEACALAETKLAEISASDTSSHAGSSGGDFGPEWQAYRWNASTASADAELAEIRVRVTWNARGADRFVELTSFAYANSDTTVTTGGTQ
jgi:prepilin-type N-terminal cleavage/methylation domain-containing protein